MVELIVGIILMVIFLMIAMVILKPLFLSIVSQSVNVIEIIINLIPLSYIIPFFIVAIFLIFKGRKKILTDKQTQADGEICYGKIIDVFKTGVIVMGKPQFQVKALVYIPSMHKKVEITETIGFGPAIDEYVPGKFVEVKYCNGDINFERVLGYEKVPYGYEEELDVPIKKDDVVVINGNEYIRKDCINDKK